MFNLQSIVDLGATSCGKTATSVLAGTTGAVILMLFLNTIVLPATSLRFLPLVIAFNAALTGYMVLEKTRESFQHKWTVAMLAGAAATLLVYVILNAFFMHTTGLYLIGATHLLIILTIGIGASWFGGVLAINYLKLN
jgi:hypothetical protein